MILVLRLNGVPFSSGLLLERNRGQGKRGSGAANPPLGPARKGERIVWGPELQVGSLRGVESTGFSHGMPLHATLSTESSPPDSN
jgi:hypothetical protein